MDTNKIIENIDKGIENGKKRAEAKSALNDLLESPLRPKIMEVIANQMREHGTKEVHEKLWTCSLFPERVTQEMLDIFVDYIEERF